jgi:hypothetical protein
MAKKTFKIGEYAIGGIIAVEIVGKIIEIKVLDYFTKKELSRCSTFSQAFGSERKIDDFLNEVTTSYYTDKIMEWIKLNTMLN